MFESKVLHHRSRKQTHATISVTTPEADGGISFRTSLNQTLGNSTRWMHLSAIVCQKCAWSALPTDGHSPVIPYNIKWPNYLTYESWIEGGGFDCNVLKVNVPEYAWRYRKRPKRGQDIQPSASLNFYAVSMLLTSSRQFFIHVNNGYLLKESLSLVSHRRGPCSRPGQFMWDLWWTKWHWDILFSESFGFLLSVSFHRCSIFTYISGWWARGPLAAQFHRDIVSPHRNINNNKHCIFGRPVDWLVS
jgi:hypothetical protein